MGRKRISDDEYEKRIKQILSAIKGVGTDSETVSKFEISKLTGLTGNQISSAIKKQRQVYLKKPHLVKNGYIVSNSKGYKLNTTYKDCLKAYKTACDLDCSFEDIVANTLLSISMNLSIIADCLEEEIAPDLSNMGDDMFGILDETLGINMRNSEG